jgi:hypothetical protein
MAANDAEISRLHDASPPNTRELRLLQAELVARGLSAFGRDMPSIAKALCLPRFAGHLEHLAWPVGLP